jgi:hypothetical protein
MRVFAYLHAWVHMALTGHFSACDPAWSDDGSGTYEIPVVVCDDDGRFYRMGCSATECW